MRSFFLLLSIGAALAFYQWGTNQPPELPLERSKSTGARQTPKSVAQPQDKAARSNALGASQNLRLPSIRSVEELAVDSRRSEFKKENETIANRGTPFIEKSAEYRPGLLSKSTDEEAPFDRAFVDDERLDGIVPDPQFGNDSLDGEILNDQKPDLQARSSSSWTDPDQDSLEESSDPSKVETD
jgi:hypothetical protein